MITKVRNYITKKRVQKMNAKRVRIKHMIIAGWTTQQIAQYLNMDESEVRAYWVE